MKNLKSLFAVAILFLGLNINAMYAQQKEPIITVVKTVDVSADKVWEQLRIMDNIDQLSSSVASVTWKGKHGVGGERVCLAPEGKGKFVESIIAFSDIERTYTYAVVEGVPAKNMVNNFKVVDLGYNKSMIVWTSSFEFMENPNMKEEQFQGFLKSASAEMIASAVALVKKG